MSKEFRSALVGAVALATGVTLACVVYTPFACAIAVLVGTVIRVLLWAAGIQIGDAQ